MLDLHAFFRPQSLDEALNLLHEHGERARPLAGGSSLIFAKGAPFDTLVDLGDVGLDGLTMKDAEMHLGAMVRVSNLRRHMDHLMTTTALTEAARGLYSRVIQNHVTVGGNCVMVYGWSDLPVVTWALGARFVLKSTGGEREVDADTFYAKHPTKLIASDELLTTILIPAIQKHAGSAYCKQGRDKTDEALASAAARVLLAEDGSVLAARVVVGAVRPLPQKIDAPPVLVGAQPEEATLRAAATAIAQDLTVTESPLASADYRRELVAVLIEDALTAAVARAGESK
ncbi:MAG: FAD binding domain-containing protein [Deltaproteobacteria bacterium]|nr:FAD binding domain-containing protein [Deltaproteobacteria bacterium]